MEFTVDLIDHVILSGDTVLLLGRSILVEQVCNNLVDIPVQELNFGRSSSDGKAISFHKCVYVDNM